MSNGKHDWMLPFALLLLCALLGAGCSPGSAGQKPKWELEGWTLVWHDEFDGATKREWVFDHPFFVVLNVAVGGYWPGDPDETTAFPQTMQVDYVRVYQRADGANTSED